MENDADFTSTLRDYMARAARGNHALASLTGISVRTIEKWVAGEVRRPRFVTDVLKVARALALDEQATTILLRAAGHPTLAGLRDQAQQVDDPQLRALLADWQPAPASAASSSPAAAGGPPVVSAMRYQLRAPVANFVGRECEMDRLIAHLRTALAPGVGAVISGVQGMGGIGKTELAYRVAHQLREVFADAQIVLDLRGTNSAPLPCTQALQAVIRAFDRTEKLPDDLSELQPLYRSVLHARRVLILADDAHDATQVWPLLPPPGCALLVTSRQRFSLPGMMTIDLEQLHTEEAISFLRDSCTRLRVDEARMIAQTCGYLPLALRVSGAMLCNNPALPVATYLQRLADERQRLRQLRDPDDGHLDVEASLALSYALLDEPTQQVFRQLGILTGDFDASMALAVVEAEVGVDVEAALYKLLRRNLVMYDSVRARWRLHDLARDLARSYLELAGEAEPAAWRYASAAMQIAQATQEHYRRGGEAVAAALTRFDTERMHIDTARSWAADHAGTVDGDALLVPDALATYDIGRLRYNRRSAILPQLLGARAAAQRLADQYAEGYILKLLGNAYLELGTTHQAIAAYEQARIIMREIRDLQGEGKALSNLGTAHHHLGEIQRAISAYTQALAIKRATGDRRSESLTLGNLGRAYMDLGEPRQALVFYEQALAIKRVIGDRRGEGLILGSLGLAYVELGEVQRALPVLVQALVIVRALGDRPSEGYTLDNLGRAYLACGEAQRAVQPCTHALAIAREVGDQPLEGTVLSTLGRSYVAQGATAEATTIFAEALTIFQVIGDRWSEAECRWHFGLLLAFQGDRQPALALLRAAVAYEEEIGHARAAEHVALLARIEAGEEVLAELPREYVEHPLLERVLARPPR